MFLNLFLIPMLFTFVFIAALYPCAIKFGLTDKPTHRKQHTKPTPLIGGLAIYLGVLATLLIQHNPLPNQNALIFAITLLVCIGLVDDYKGLGVKIRLLVQIAAGLIMTEYADIKIENLGNLFGLGDIHLGILATPFTVFAVVGGINAFNMIDGIDGLAGSLTLVSILSIAEISWMSPDRTLLAYCLIFTAAIIAFLSLNLPILGRSNAKIFLGDTGSTLSGFVVCWLAIDASQGEYNLISPSTVLWIMALPLLDSVCIMLRRIGKGMSPFNPDREHLHHIFSVAGYSKNSTLALIIIISLSLSTTGVTASRYFGAPESLLFFTFIALFAGHYWLMSHAWKIMKISRYLRVTKVLDRRVEEPTKPGGKRSESDRRFIPSEHQVERIYRGSGGLIAPLLGQRFRKKNEPDRRSQNSLIETDSQVLENNRTSGERRNSQKGLNDQNDKKTEQMDHIDPN